MIKKLFKWLHQATCDHHTTHSDNIGKYQCIDCGVKWL